MNYYKNTTIWSTKQKKPKNYYINTNGEKIKFEIEIIRINKKEK